MKTCCTCKQTKPFELFGKESARPDGKKRCKDCHNIGNREYRERHPEKSAASSANWVKNNLERKRQYQREWVNANPGKMTEFMRKWRAENPERNWANQRRYVERPEIRLHRSMRNRITTAIRGGRRTFEHLGYTREQLMAHLERQFSSGMSWENYGEWHVDHIRPLASFDITDGQCEDFKIAWCLTNLRPLWASENLAKSARNLFLI
jgi:hypothetical protein